MLAPGWIKLPVNDIMNMHHDKVYQEEDEDNISISTDDHMEQRKQKLAVLAQKKLPILYSRVAEDANLD